MTEKFYWRICYTSQQPCRKLDKLVGQQKNSRPLKQYSNQMLTAVGHAWLLARRGAWDLYCKGSPLAEPSNLEKRHWRIAPPPNGDSKDLAACSL